MSLNELSTQLSLNVRTTERYLDLLEKLFDYFTGVIQAEFGEMRFFRQEKILFLDNEAARNGIISQFNGLENRDDVGALWAKFYFYGNDKSAYKERYANRYFGGHTTKKKLIL